jgi:hypothetical protein
MMMQVAALPSATAMPTVDIGWNQLSVSPTSFKLGTGPVGTTSQTTITIENSGSGELSGQVSAASLPPFIPQGSGAFDMEPGATTTLTFGVTAGAGAFSLTHDQTKVVKIKFAASAVATSLGSITITSNDPFNGAAAQVSVSGTGVSGTLTLSTTALNFAPVKAGKRATLKLAIENVGLGVLHGSIDATSKLGNPFSAKGAGKFTLADYKSHVVVIRFAPETTWHFQRHDRGQQRRHRTARPSYFSIFL